MYNTGHYVQPMPKSVNIQKLASYFIIKKYVDKNQIYTLLFEKF